MKYLLITKNYPKTFCGVGDYTYYLAKELSLRGMNIEVLTSKNQEILENGVTVHPTIKRFNLFNILPILREIKRIDPHEVNLQYVPQMTGIFGLSLSIGILSLFAKLFTKYKLTVTMHEFFIPFKGNIVLKAIAMIQRLNFILIIKSAKNLIVTTEKRKNYLNRFIPPFKIELIPVGSNIPIAQVNDRQKSTLRKKYCPPEYPLFCSFGTSSRDKNYNRIIEIIAEINRSGTKARLLMIGDIKKDPKVINSIMDTINREKISDKVFLTGKLGKEEVSKLIQVSDYFIFNQVKGISTGSGTLSAAFAHSKPVIANHMNSIESIFKNGENVFLTDMNETGNAAKEITQFIKDNTLIEKISSAGHNLYKDYLSWASIAKRF